MIKSGSISVFVTCIISMINQTNAQITFSEIMFDVATNEYHDEFIELFNYSYFDSIDVDGFQFSDGDGVDNILPLKGGRKIPPRSFAVILDGSYLGNSTIYDTIIPDTVILLTISDNSFGKNGLSNTLSENLTLCNSMGEILSSYSYSIGNQPGRSDEKIEPGGTNDPDNWADSRRDGGTPGWQNSVTPFQYDFGFDETSLILPDKIFSEMSVTLSVQIHQYGTATLTDSMEILIFSDLNHDTVYQQEDILIGQKNLFTSAQVIDFEWGNIATGIHMIVAEVRFEGDQNLENNRCIQSIEVLSPGGDVTINEIKFLTNSNESEWLELYNSGKEEVYLRGWSIADKSDTVMINSTVYISPSSYLVLAKEPLHSEYQLLKDDLIILEKFITFNDQGDEICLYSPNGDEIEKVSYLSNWLEGEAFRNPSLEKIHPILAPNRAENWGPCVNDLAGTPGLRNSIYSSLARVSGKIEAAPDPFSPDDDGFEDVTLISGSIPESSGRIRVIIFDIKGRQIRTLRENNFTGSQFNFVWNGRDDNGQLARIGIYIVYIQIINDRRGTSYEMKTTVILANKL